MAIKKYNKVDEAEKNNVRGALKRLLEKHSDVVFAYLHGSFVRGEDFGDIDIALYVMKMPAAPLEYELSLEAECREVISPYPVDVRFLNGAPLSFRYQVIKEGLLLLVRDDEKRSDFQEATIADYFDFAPYRARYLKETLGLGV
jgi:uncharacterized protein